MRDTTETRRRLETKLTDLLSRHSRLNAHLRNRDRELPSDWQDLAQFVENDEVLEVLEERTRERVEAIAGALRRLDAGTYGMCASCGAEIADERLELLPTTRVCASCA
jgi:RNA polymerase-binding protein DksA